MKKLFAAAFLAACLLLALLPPAGEAGGFKVVVHPSNKVGSLPADQVARLFLKKATTWETGRKVAPVDQVERSPVREAFSKAVLGKAASSVKVYWQQQIFSGKDVPPPEVAGDAEVAAFVRSNPDAIGYVASDFKADGLKIVNVGP